METEVAVVTGGAGGLGQLITQRLAQRGFVVAIADIDRDAAAELTAELAGQGSRAYSSRPTLPMPTTSGG